MLNKAIKLFHSSAFIYVLFFGFFSSNALAEIVTNSLGEKIELKSDGTWSYVSGESTIVHEGSKEIIFHFKIWAVQAQVIVEKKYNSFTKENEFQKVSGRCKLDGVIDYSGNERVVFDAFIAPLILNITGHRELSFLAVPQYDEVFEPLSKIGLATGWSVSPSETIQSSNIEDIDTISKQIQAFCDWSNLSNFRPETLFVDGTFESGRKLDNNFWQYSKIEILHKTPKFVLKE